jgi:plastocyanin domain-containing protein
MPKHILTAILASLALAGTAAADGKPTRVEISITPKGFDPDHVTVKKDQPVVLAFTRKTDKTCAKAVVVDLGGGKKITKDLPLDKTVEISATFTKTGELGYACGMDMVHGVMTVQ